MAHSYVMVFDDEIEAFRTFAGDFPDRAVLLIDTFDTEEGARRATRIAGELAPDHALIGVRLDSGDIARLAPAVRRILDEAGLEKTKIFVSGDLDEDRIEELLSSGAPVDAFGVGTQMGTSGDAPSLGTVYKLVADDSRPKVKLSTGKATLPGIKQVFRKAANGRYEYDVIGLHDERLEGEPILHPVMRGGQRTVGPEPLDVLRERCRGSIERLPDPLKSLHHRQEYAVRLSDQLESLLSEVRDRVARTSTAGPSAGSC